MSASIAYQSSSASWLNWAGPCGRLCGSHGGRQRLGRGRGDGEVAGRAGGCAGPALPAAPPDEKRHVAGRVCLRVARRFRVRRGLGPDGRKNIKLV
eukprot:1702079-Lingulodinium_polyedra.AAC.1